MPPCLTLPWSTPQQGAGIACQALLATAPFAYKYSPRNWGALQWSDEYLSLNNLSDNCQCVKWGGSDASALKQRCQFENHNRGVVSEHTIIFYKELGLVIFQPRHAPRQRSGVFRAGFRSEEGKSPSWFPWPPAPSSPWKHCPLSPVGSLGNTLSRSISGSFPGK